MIFGDTLGGGSWNRSWEMFQFIAQKKNEMFFSSSTQKKMPRASLFAYTSQYQLHWMIKECGYSLLTPPKSAPAIKDKHCTLREIYSLLKSKL